MKRALVIATACLAACAGGEAVPDVSEPAPAMTTIESSTTPSPTSTTAVESPATTVSTAPPTTRRDVTAVSAPGTYDGADFAVHLQFISEIPEASSLQIEAISLEILNGPDGWRRSGFTFVADAASGLTVILAEGDRVDELCLPLETFGKVSCQNGPVVALNADRWRLGGDDWDSTLETYRTYLINHEVGHLIGLRHPVERCPTASKVSALMEPQTNNLQDCVGNGIPLDWEIEWALRRPVVIGPDPEWDGPRPNWPGASGE